MKHSTFFFLLFLVGCASNKKSTEVVLKDFIQLNIEKQLLENPSIFENENLLGDYLSLNAHTRLLQKVDLKNLLIIPKNSAVAKQLYDGKYFNGLVIIRNPNKPSRIILDGKMTMREIRYALNGEFITYDKRKIRKLPKNAKIFFISNKGQNWDLFYIEN